MAKLLPPSLANFFWLHGFKAHKSRAALCFCLGTVSFASGQLCHQLIRWVCIAAGKRITVVTDSLSTVAFVMCLGHPPVPLVMSKMMVLGLHMPDKPDFNFFFLTVLEDSSASLCRVFQCMIACGPVLQLPLPRECSAPTKESTGRCQNTVPRT